MIRCAVLGSPIEHSRSPLLHATAYEILGIEADYQRFEVKADELSNFLSEHGPEQWRGFSLTMPLKEVASEIASQVSTSVSRTGSANTLISSGAGWIGENTDELGFRYLLTGANFDSVAILGAGGTARSALAALSQFTGEVRIYRRDSRGDSALQRIRPGVLIENWTSVDQAFESDVVINAAPIAAAADYQDLARPVALVIDALYSPWPPPLAEVQSPNNYCSGLELLVAQGMEQVVRFCEVEIDRNWLFPQLLRAIS